MIAESPLLIPNPDKEIARIAGVVKQQVVSILRRRGLVLGISGGIDSSVCAALAVRAVGRDRVFAILMPERGSSGESVRLGKLAVECLGIQHRLEDIGPLLEAAGCYAYQEEAVREVLPEFRQSWKFKLVLGSVIESDRLPLTSIIVETDTGETVKVRLPARSYHKLVAATNFKQRVRKMIEYYHADRLHYAVCGTPNRLEYDQGFFVKNGDGSADVKPICHLYKSQVYQLAQELRLPEEIRAQAPTTDTYSLSQTQEEFYFGLPYQHMDHCLYGLNNGVAPDRIATLTGLSREQVVRTYQDIESKRRATQYQHLAPLLVDPVPEITASHRA